MLDTNSLQSRTPNRCYQSSIGFSKYIRT